MGGRRQGSPRPAAVAPQQLQAGRRRPAGRPLRDRRVPAQHPLPRNLPCHSGPTAQPPPLTFPLLCRAPEGREGRPGTARRSGCAPRGRAGGGGAGTASAAGAGAKRRLPAAADGSHLLPPPPAGLPGPMGPRYVPQACKGSHGKRRQGASRECRRRPARSSRPWRLADVRLLSHCPAQRPCWRSGPSGKLFAGCSCSCAMLPLPLHAAVSAQRHTTGGTVGGARMCQ